MVNKIVLAVICITSVSSMLLTMEERWDTTHFLTMQRDPYDGLACEIPWCFGPYEENSSGEISELSFDPLRNLCTNVCLREEDEQCRHRCLRCLFVSVLCLREVICTVLCCQE